MAQELAAAIVAMATTQTTKLTDFPADMATINFQSHREYYVRGGDDGEENDPFPDRFSSLPKAYRAAVAEGYCPMHAAVLCTTSATGTGDFNCNGNAPATLFGAFADSIMQAQTIEHIESEGKIMVVLYKPSTATVGTAAATANATTQASAS
jgi:hypothetical protein